MTTAAVVLAGGRGTRSADPGTAKVAQIVGGKSVMEWHLQLLTDSRIDECLIVAGYLGQQVDELCAELPRSNVELCVLHEEQQNGTVEALRFAARNTDADYFLVILGDVLTSFPVDAMLDAWEQSGMNVAVVVHPSTHPHDSDTVFTRHDGTVAVRAKSEDHDDLPNMASAGIFAITRNGLSEYSECEDFGSGVLSAAASRQDLFPYISSHYFKDTGTPDRLAAAIRDVDSGVFAIRGSTTPRPALLLDRDGVINPTSPESYTPDHYSLLPEVPSAIRAANACGIPVIVITNQPHIAKGFMSFSDHERVRARMDALLGEEGAFVDDYYFCPHHPDSGYPGEVPELKRNCSCRKPFTGLVEQAAVDHLLDVESSVFVGDSDRDRELAQRLQIEYIHVCADNECPESTECFTSAAAAIRRGTEVLSC
jgi:histidinol-phosphate phosphatase family protein